MTCFTKIVNFCAALVLDLIRNWLHWFLWLKCYFEWFLFFVYLSYISMVIHISVLQTLFGSCPCLMFFFIFLSRMLAKVANSLAPLALRFQQPDKAAVETNNNESSECLAFDGHGLQLHCRGMHLVLWTLFFPPLTHAAACRKCCYLFHCHWSYSV